MKIYLASALSEAPRMRDYSDKFRLAGMQIVSRWHDIVEDDAVDPHSLEGRRAILMENLRDLDAADAVYANTCAGLPSAAFCEVAWAISRGKTVVWSMPPGKRRSDGVRCTNIFDAHELVTIVHSVEEVIPALRRLQ